MQQVEDISSKYEVDCIGLMEINTNWLYLKNTHNKITHLRHCLSGGNSKISQAHNEWEAVEKHQPGGVGMIVKGQLTKFAKETEADFRGLGRWMSWRFHNNNGMATRIVVAYRNGNSRKGGLKSIFSQHQRYIDRNQIKKGDRLIYPQELFDEDLIHQCKLWQDLGDKIILLADINDKVATGTFKTRLESQAEGLKEVTHKWLGNKNFSTHINGSYQIDGAFMSEGIELTNVCFLDFNSSPGDHRAMILDISSRSMIGEYQQKVIRPVERRLVLSNAIATNSYISLVEEQFKTHRIVERQRKLETEAKMEVEVTVELRVKFERLSKQIEQIQRHAERHCRKIKRPEGEFSPEVKCWYNKWQAVKNLLRQAGKPGIKGTLLDLQQETIYLS